ncbi:MFS transporter [Oceanobacillus bengalensis]|uniref:MFS transporter n=1 Tax=Oceanobacillus bengalensis TaxID=1435466 RepID=A0A494Z0Q9_9BACI|nr:MFS transporter [Oceanobacillus bengalensis]RKQ15868.1 MFS transporter [Oceanobacillus bengalensis]
MTTNRSASPKWAITLFTMGVFMAGLDNGIISTALTTISDSFHVSAAWGAWTVTLYTLGIAISTPVIGKLSDRYGRKRLFIIEIALFGIGSVLVALSPNFIFLLVARFIQALGGGGIFIIGSSYILSTLPKESQGKALGMLGGMHGLSAVIGPNLGAVILGLTGSWQWMFLINIPIAIFLIIFGFLKLEETKAGTEKPLDITGTLLLSISILSFMYGITQLDSDSFVHSLLFIIVGLILFTLFIIHEKRVEKGDGDPILAFSLLSKLSFKLTLVLGLLSGGFLAGIIFIPAYVEQVLLVPVEQAGYWVTPMALAAGVGAGLGGVLSDKIGPVKTVIIAGVIGVSGFGLFSFLVEGFLMFVVASSLAGIGLGMLMGAPLNMLAGASADESEKGTALGTVSLLRQIGLTIFPALFAGLIAGSKSGYSQMFFAAMVLALLVLIIGFYINRKKLI